MAFDLLALDDRDLTGEPFAERRRLLESVLGGDLGRVHLTPMTDDPDVAEDWFTRFEGAGFDGVMAKPADQPYQQDKRVMWKVKHERTADCVVAGFRWHKDGEGVGSLLLGLFDDDGTLHHVGVASSFTAARRTRAGRRAGAAARATPSTTTRGATGPTTRPQAQADGARCRAASAGGTPRRTSRGSRCAPSWWPRSATSTCSAAASATAVASCASAPTARPTVCTYAQLDEVAPAELGRHLPARRDLGSGDRVEGLVACSGRSGSRGGTRRCRAPWRRRSAPAPRLAVGHAVEREVLEPRQEPHAGALGDALEVGQRLRRRCRRAALIGLSTRYMPGPQCDG